MKKVILTLGVMCCVSFAFAKEGEDSKKSENDLKSEYLSIEKENNVSLDEYWFHTTCGRIFKVDIPENRVVAMWKYLESRFCGRQF